MPTAIRARTAVATALLAFAPLLLPTAGAEAQALPFHTATSITAGFDENAARHFGSVVGRSNLVRDGGPVPDPANRTISGQALVNGVILGAFTPLWTFRVAVPWVRKEMDFTTPDGRRVEFETSGIGDGFLQSKWVFYRVDRPAATTRVGIQGRLKVPLGDTDARLPSGERAPRPLQVGTGAWDFEPTLLFTDIERRWGFHGNVGWRVTGRDEGFEAGERFLYDAAVGFRFLPWVYESLQDQSLIAYLELNGEVARRNEVAGTTDPNSGGHVLFLSPDLQWVPTPWLLFEGSVQIPIHQDLNGTQLEHETRFQLGTRYRFSVFR